MDLTIVKSYLGQQIGQFRKEIEKEYGPMDLLEHTVNREGCRLPGEVDALMVWNALAEEDITLIERVVLFNPEVFNAITQKRMELLEYLATHRVDSIRELSLSLKRDYKNVYDDVKALERFELIRLERAGKNLRPITQTERISIGFG